MGRNPEIFHIAGNRVELRWDFPWLYLLMAIPWILHIYILRHIIALHLDVCRNLDVLPGLAAIIHHLKSMGRDKVIAGIGKLPQPIQGIAETAYSALHFLHRSVTDMI